MDLSRSFRGTSRERRALKRLDRLLSNPDLQLARDAIFQAITQRLLSSPMPLIIVDWSDLKRDGRWCLLRAAVPVKGRCLTILELVVPRKKMGNGKVQRMLLAQLKAPLLAHVCPILITDACFCTDWFTAVEALDWHRIGRLRGRMRIRLRR